MDDKEFSYLLKGELKGPKFRNFAYLDFYFSSNFDAIFLSLKELTVVCGWISLISYSF